MGTLAASKGKAKPPFGITRLITAIGLEIYFRRSLLVAFFVRTKPSAIE